MNALLLVDLMQISFLLCSWFSYVLACESRAFLLFFFFSNWRNVSSFCSIKIQLFFFVPFYETDASYMYSYMYWSTY